MAQLFCLLRGHVLIILLSRVSLELIFSCVVFKIRLLRAKEEFPVSILRLELLRKGEVSLKWFRLAWNSVDRLTVTWNYLKP